MRDFFKGIIRVLVIAVLLIGPHALVDSAHAESIQRRTSTPKQVRGRKKPEDKQKKKDDGKKAEEQKETEVLEQAEKAEKEDAAGGKRASSTKVQEYYEPFYRYQLNLLLGINIIEGESGIVSGAQLGFALGKNKPWYLGPEINFSLYSPGSIIMPLLGIWHQLRIYRSPRLSVATGLLLGASIPSNVPFLDKTSFTAFFEAVISQELNDVATVRGQLRPGFMGNDFAFMMNLNVTFRFR